MLCLQLNDKFLNYFKYKLYKSPLCRYIHFSTFIVNMRMVVSLLGLMDIVVGVCLENIKYNSKRLLSINLNLYNFDNGERNIGA